LYLAQAAGDRKDYTSASKQFKVLLDAQPNNPAWALAQIKDPKAIDYAEKAYKLAPDQPAIIDTVGWLFVEKGDLTHGLGLLHKASGMAPQNALIRFNPARALVKAGKKADANKELDELVNLGKR